MEYELHYVDGTYLQGRHTVRVEYYEHTGRARVRAWWEDGTDGDGPPTYLEAPTVATGPAAAPAPAVAAGPTATPAPAEEPAADAADDPWLAAYFATDDLSGEPVLTRVETALDHNWRFGSPGEDVPKDHFSARWTQSASFQGGSYRFTTYTDDGVRLWVGGRLVINAWRPMRGYRSATVRLSEGLHDVRMEYYERTGAALARLTWRRVGR